MPILTCTGIFKTRRHQGKVYCSVLVLGGSLNLWVPESFVPDQYEGKEVHVTAAAGFGKNGLYWRVETLTVK